MQNYLPLAALLVTAVAALLGALAAFSPVRDSMDHFIADLHRQGQLAGAAALAAALATAIQIVHYFLSGPK
jgi:hypothetical protein